MLLAGKGDPRSLAAQCIGTNLADLAIEALTTGKLETAVIERRDPAKCKGRVNARFDAPPVEALERPRRETNELVRQGLAMLLAICEHVTLHGEYEGRIAAGAHLFMGHQRAPDRDGVWCYVPRDGQGSLAARMHSDVRQLERFKALLVAGKVMKAWQPPPRDENGKPLPEHLRGETHAYGMYSLQSVPTALALTIRRFTGRVKEARGLERAELVEAPVRASEALDLGDLGELAEQLARSLRTRDPPS